MTRRLVLLLFLVGLLLARVELRAEEKPAAKERLRPDGIDGALILCGGKVSEAARNRFFDLAGNDKANLIIVTFGDKTDRENAGKLAEAWKEQKPAAVVIYTSDKSDLPLVKALREASGVWFADADTKALVKLANDKETVKELAALLKRGSVIGATSGAALASSGLGLLPGAIVETAFHKGESEKLLFAALEKKPGSYGIGLSSETALVVQGRDVTVAGGEAIICLAKSPTKVARSIAVKARMPSDLTLLRRAAMARAEAPFPPKEAPVPEVAKGSLVIVGGGGMPANVTKRFIELAGGPEALIVVLPTAQPDPVPLNSEGAFFKKAGAKNVVVLPSRTLKGVEDPQNLAILKKAGGIWFGGGRQWRFVDAYEGTKAQALFNDVLRRGGVIGGSSAGASIQGDYLCRGDPLGNLDIMCEGYERGLGFLPGVAIDQHFKQRNRFADMTALVKTYPQLLGIGIDETTALIVKGHVADIMGQGEAHFYDRKKPVEKDKPDHESVKAGGRYDLKERKELSAEK